MDGIVAGIIVPVGTFRDSIPLFHRAREGDVRQDSAIAEYTATDRGYAVWYGYACQSIVIIENLFTYRGYTVWNNDAC